MLAPQFDHQSECLLHSLFLGCVSRGLLGFSHEDIIDFDIGAHGPPHSGRVYPCMTLYTFGSRPATTERKVIVLQAGLIRKVTAPCGTRRARKIQRGEARGLPRAERSLAMGCLPERVSRADRSSNSARKTGAAVTKGKPVLAPEASAELRDRLLAGLGTSPRRGCRNLGASIPGRKEQADSAG